MILRNLGSNTKTCASAAALLLMLFMTCTPTIAQESEPEKKSDPVEAQASDPAETQVQARKATGAPIIDDGSPGMYIALNGGSVRKFEKDLEEVREQTTPEEFVTVQNALDYLLVYDLSARRDKKRLYKNLDGKTPAEIVAMVKWRIEGRGRYRYED